MANTAAHRATVLSVDITQDATRGFACLTKIGFFSLTMNLLRMVQRGEMTGNSMSS
ncbi:MULTISPECIES: hypothetical protein [unclassified Mesorhizobium]|uniref:hypothetical protein n=1 Tax=unclassified Mesorhizobium TaxID=325217 RepID=UPI0015E3F602|nr:MULTISPECIES: hypothetical protein [unclassified Mesorhizobium]